VSIGNFLCRKWEASLRGKRGVSIILSSSFWEAQGLKKSGLRVRDKVRALSVDLCGEAAKNLIKPPSGLALISLFDADSNRLCKSEQVTNSGVESRDFGETERAT
jgi:hypothetical protein